MKNYKKLLILVLLLGTAAFFVAKILIGFYGVPFGSILFKGTMNNYIETRYHGKYSWDSKRFGYNFKYEAYTSELLGAKKDGDNLSYHICYNWHNRSIVDFFDINLSDKNIEEEIGFMLKDTNINYEAIVSSSFYYMKVNQDFSESSEIQREGSRSVKIICKDGNMISLERFASVIPPMLEILHKNIVYSDDSSIAIAYTNNKVGYQFKINANQITSIKYDIFKYIIKRDDL